MRDIVRFPQSLAEYYIMRDLFLKWDFVKNSRTPFLAPFLFTAHT